MQKAGEILSMPSIRQGAKNIEVSVPVGGSIVVEVGSGNIVQFHGHADDLIVGLESQTLATPSATLAPGVIVPAAAVVSHRMADGVESIKIYSAVGDTVNLSIW